MFTVYRIFDADGGCMYVGCSDNPWGRVARHARRADLPAPIANVAFTHHTSTEEALRTERAEIARLRPTLNVKGLRPSAHRAGETDRLKTVLAEIVRINRPTTSSELSARLGFKCATQVHRLRHDGVLRDVGLVGGGHCDGRPRFLFVLADEVDRQEVSA